MLSERFPKDGSNYKYENIIYNDEFNFKKGEFRVKSFDPYAEYENSDDPIFYFEDADFIVAPAFYAPSAQQEPDKPPKYILVKNSEELISEELMKEAFCMYDGTFNPNTIKHNYGTDFFAAFSDDMDYALVRKGTTVHKDEYYDYNKDPEFLEKKKYYLDLRQCIASLVTLRIFTTFKTVKDKNSGDEFIRITDLNNKRDPEKIRGTRRWIRHNDYKPLSELMSQQEDRAAILPYAQLKYWKEDHYKENNYATPIPEDASFFQLMLHAFYHYEDNILIYKSDYATVPIYYFRDLDEIRERKEKGFSLEKDTFKFWKFTGAKIAMFFKSCFELSKNWIQGIEVGFYTGAISIIFYRAVIYTYLTVYDLGYVFVKVFKFIFRIKLSDSAEEKKEVREIREENLNLRRLLRAFKDVEISVLWGLNVRQRREKDKKKKK